MYTAVTINMSSYVLDEPYIIQSSYVVDEPIS